MITCHEKNLVETVNLGEARDFQIKATREAFEILSSKLYSNKALAIIRELSCNAQDSHVAAGNKEPIIVHLPTILQPYFSVKDNGIGLSEDDINNLYTTYFGTNKNQSNDFTGCFGLGSKSPFCYTDNFTVVSRYDGIKTTYVCFKNAVGFPSVSKVSSEETSESNGLEVIVPTKEVSLFAKEASLFYEFFTPRPKILNKSFEFLDFKKIHETDDFVLVKTDKYNYMSGVYVLMGNIAYKTNSCINFVKYGHDLTLLLKANIGDVDITASRESLEFGNSNKTSEFISNKYKIAEHSIGNHLKEKLNECPSLHEARIFAIENYFVFGDYINYKGKSYSKVPDMESIKSHVKIKYKVALSKIKHWKSVRQTVPYEKAMFILNDADKYINARFNKIYDLNHGKFPVLLTYCDAVLNLLKNEEIPYLKLSEVDVTQEVTEKRLTKRKKGIVYKINLGYYTRKQDYVRKLEDYDYNTNINYYVLKDGDDLVFNGKSSHPEYMTKKINSFRSLSNNKTEVFAVSNKSENTLVKAGWKKFDDVVNNFISQEKPERRLDIYFTLESTLKNDFVKGFSSQNFSEKSGVAFKFASKIEELTKELKRNEINYKHVYEYKPKAITELIDLDKAFSKEYTDIIQNVSHYNKTFMTKVINLQDFYKTTEKKNES